MVLLLISKFLKQLNIRKYLTFFCCCWVLLLFQLKHVSFIITKVPKYPSKYFNCSLDFAHLFIELMIQRRRLFRRKWGRTTRAMINYWSQLYLENVQGKSISANMQTLLFDLLPYLLLSVVMLRTPSKRENTTRVFFDSIWGFQLT